MDTTSPTYILCAESGAPRVQQDLQAGGAGGIVLLASSCGNIGGVMTAGIVFVGSWHGAAHATWNAIALLIWLLYAGGVLFAPAAVFRRGWRQKIWWIIVGAGPFVVFSGFNIPVVLVTGWPFLILHYRDTTSARRAPAPSAESGKSGYSIPGYGNVGRP